MSAQAEVLPQHMQALENANRIRLIRAGIKNDIRSGALTVSEVLSDPAPELENMTIFELVAAQHRWGRTRARKLLFHVAISENRTIGALTERQRLLLIEQAP